MKLIPKFNKDWAVLAGSAILAIGGLVVLHQKFQGYVPTLPGVSYGPGGVATGIYTTPGGPPQGVPILNPAYQDIRGISDPLASQIQGAGRGVVGGVQNFESNWGGWHGQGGVGRGSYRDAWTDVYDPNKNTGSITHDIPDKRVTLA